MDGRDNGTVVFPHADLKIFMTASPEVRAMRRYLELKEKNQQVDIEDIKKFRASFEENNKDTEKNKKENEAFWNQVINLAPGSYHIVNGKVVKD